MPLSPFFETLLVGTTVIISLFVCYSFFEMNFNYFLYFELIFLLVFIGFDLIEYYWLAVVILVLAVLAYRAISPHVMRLKGQ